MFRGVALEGLTDKEKSPSAPRAAGASRKRTLEGGVAGVEGPTS